MNDYQPKEEWPLLVWLDLETSCTDERAPNACILEIAVIFTEPNLLELGKYHSLVEPAVPPARWDPYVRAMHERSGLLAELLDPRDTDVRGSLETIEEELVQLLRKHKRSSPSLDAQKPQIAGASVGNFDLQWIKQFMPGLYQRFSHRVLDVGSVARTIRWSFNDLKEPGQDVHRAMHDVEHAIKWWAECKDAVRTRTA